jgi:membrane-bound lytic murein transglycosylase D
MSKLSLAAALALALLHAPTGGWAQQEPAEADEETIDADLGPPRVESNEAARRSVRGSLVDDETVDPRRAALRAFEREAFAAPIELSATVPPEDDGRPDIPWIKALATGDVPVRWDARVIRFLEFYKNDSRGRAVMTAWIRRSGRYRDLILDALRRHGLPEDLLYICMIESSFNPLVVSRVGATGLWQYMPAAGHAYGLRQDYWVDERSDPEKATEAQMLYFKDLWDRFGNWDLAAAAFNAGYGAVLKSMAKYGTNDFWALLEIEAGLPWESSVYVPKFLAAAVVGRNLAAFGYDKVVLDPPLAFERVTVPGGVDLTAIARAAGVEVAAVRELNPSLRRDRTPPGSGDVVVRIPEGTRERFAREFPQLKSEWDGFETYVLRHGERFEDVAKVHGLSTARLRSLNGVRHVTEVRGGTLLVVPRIDAQVKAQNRALADDDLYRSDVVPGGPGDPLLVAVKDKDLELPGRRRVFYRVVAGDTLDDVGAAFGIPSTEIAAWNGLDADSKLAARMVLMVFVPPDFEPERRNVALLDDSRLLIVTTGSPEHLDIYEGRKGRVREVLVVKPGDTLESIGKRYSLTKYDVARINRRGYTTPLRPGEELVVYKVVDRAKAHATGVFKKRHHEVQARKAPAHQGKRPAATAPAKGKGPSATVKAKGPTATVKATGPSATVKGKGPSATVKGKGTSTAGKGTPAPGRRR